MSSPVKIGLQLYTVRDESARDFEGVLRTVAGIGFDGVEVFDLHGHEPALVRSWLDELGLVVAGRHAGFALLENELPALAAELQVLGTDRVALNWIEPPASGEDARAVVERIAAIAPRVQELGLQFGFHNHWGELRAFDGVTTIDLLSELPSDQLWFELDLGWAWDAGTDPVALLERFPGRSPLVHVKDLRSRGSREHCPVGDGAVGYERILPAALDAGVEWLIVEQDEVDGPPFDAVQRSFDAVRRFLPVTA
jgi:sugar phosphate isomerase/epimerase